MMMLKIDDFMIKKSANESPARELHNQADVLREQAQHVESIKLLDEAIILYQKDHDYEKIAGALLSRLLNYKHLTLQTHDEVFLQMTKRDGELSLWIAEKYGFRDLLGSCHFHLGEVAMLAKDYPGAIEQFKLALEHFKGPDTERGDYRYHLGEALYRGGQKGEGKQTMLIGLKEIQDNADKVSPFLAHIWESGCDLKLADLLREDEPAEARHYLEAARKIIDSDDKLVIRKKQLTELAQKLS